MDPKKLGFIGRVMVCLALALVFAACGAKKKERQPLTFKLSRKDFARSGLTDPFPADRKVCFAVNAAGDGIVPTQVDTCSPETSITAGFVADGTEITLEVPQGVNRTFEAFAYLLPAGSSTTSAPCPSWLNAEEIKRIDYTKVYSVGKASGVDISEQEVNVVLEVSFPGLANHLAKERSLPTNCNAYPKPNLTLAGTTVTEGSTATLTVGLDAASADAVTFDWSASAGTAAAGADFTAASGSASVAAGATSVVLTIPTLEDALVEADESFAVTLANAANATITTGTAQVSIVDNDVPAILIADATSAGESGLLTFTVSLSQDPVLPVTVAYATAAGTASAGTDFTAASGTLTFAAGVNSQTVTVAILSDGVAEGNESLTMTLGTAVNAMIADASGLGTITDDDSLPILAFSAATQAVGESVSVASVQVSLSSAYGAAVTVPFTVGGTATGGGSDFTLANGTLTIAAGQSSAAISVPVTDDAVSEASETVILTLGSPVNATLGSMTVHTLTINDNEGMPTISLGGATAVTEGSAAAVVVTLSSASASVVTFNYATADGTATASDADYTALSAGGSFSAGVTSVTINLATTADSRHETGETLAFSLSSVSGALSGTMSVTLTISDDDPAPAIQFASAGLSAAENAGTVNIVVQLSAVSGLPAAASFTVSGTATGGGADHTLAGGTVSIAAGQTSATIPVPLNDDASDETNETIVITLASPLNSSIGATSTHTLTISDDDATPSLMIADAASASESGSLSFPVTLDAPSAQQITVQFATSDGTATAGGDYTAASGTLTFAAGQTAQYVSVAILGDATNEGNETLTITLSSAVNATLADSAAVGTITEDDGPPVANFATASQAVNEGAGSVSVQVTLTSASGSAVTVPYTVSGTASGGGSDHNLAGGTLTIASGQTSGHVFFNLSDDSTHDPAETVILTLGTPSNANLGGTNVHTVTVNDNDAAPTLDFASATLTVSENGGTVSIAVNLSAASGLETTLTISLGGLLNSGSEYTMPGGTSLTIPAGQTMGYFVVLLSDDVLDEGDDTLILTMTSAGNAVLGSTTVHTLTATDDDSAPQIQFSTVSQSVAENVGSTSVQVQLSAASGLPATVPYTLTGTATGAGSDHTLANGTVTIAAGQSTAWISAGIQQDTLDEDDETVILTLGSPVNAAPGSNTIHTITINDDDAAPTVHIASSSNNEGSGGGTTAMTFTISLSAPSGRPVTISYATADGTASVSGTDYTAASGTLTFAAGVTTEALTVTITRDSVSEDNETLTVNLSGGANYTAAGSTMSATGTILNDDAGPTLSIASVTMLEGSGGGTQNMTFTITASSTSGLNITVAYTTSNGSAQTSDGDYNYQSGTATIFAGQPEAVFTVPVGRDDKLENDEIFNVTLSGGSNWSAAGSATTATGTIQNDDAGPSVSFGVASQSVIEGPSTVTITFIQTGVSGLATSIPFSVAGTAASGGLDHDLASGTATIQAGQTSTTLTFNIFADGIYEDDETLTVSLGAISNGSPSAPSTHVVTIDDDEAVPAVTVSDANTIEGGSLSFTISIWPLSAFDTVVSFNTSDMNATVGSDYTAHTGNATILDGTGQVVVTVNTSADGINEDSETINLNISTSSANATVVDNVGIGTILDNNPTPTVNFQAASQAANESTSTLTVRMDFSGTSALSATISYSVTGTATSGPDHNLSSGSVTIAPFATYHEILVNLTDDSAIENDETIIVTLDSGAEALIGSTSVHSITITNNDWPLVTVHPATGPENGAATVTISLNSPAPFPVQVNLSHLNGSAVAGSDFTGGAFGPQTIPASNTYISVNIPLDEDAIDELDETFTVSLSSPSNATLGGNMATVTIKDADLIFDFTTGSLPGELVFTRSSVATYFNPGGTIVTASSNQPRFDHDPVTGQPQGLLIEDPSINYLKYSAGFDQTSYWTPSLASLTTNVSGAAYLSPDGTASAEALAETNTSGAHYIQQGGLAGMAAAGPSTFTVFVKPHPTSPRIGVYLKVTDGTNSYSSMYNLLNGTTSNTTATGTSTNAISSASFLKGGWLRLRLTGNAAFPGNTGSVQIGLVDHTGATSYLGAGNAILVWGAQFEVKPYPTSYIPTTTATMNRSGDMLKMTTGFSTHYEPLAWSMVAEFARPFFEPAGASSTPNIFTMYDSGNPATTRVNAFYSPGNVDWEAEIFSSGSANGLAYGSGSTTPNRLMRLAVNRTPSNQLEIYTNGVFHMSDSAVTPPSVDTLGIGSDQSGTDSSYLNGHVRRLVYHRRGLTSSSAISKTADIQPKARFAMNTETVSETKGKAYPMVRLSHSADSNVTIPYVVTGTATGGGVDYTLPNGTITIPPGQISAVVPITLFQDSVDPNETVIINLQTPTGAELIAPSGFTLTIVD